MINVFFYFLFFPKQSNDSYNENNGTCVWYGVCQNVTATGHKLYCSYNGTAKKLDDDGLRLLTQYCPHLKNDIGDTLTCCDAEQV